jgi:hypothetical protein
MVPRNKGRIARLLLSASNPMLQQGVCRYYQSDCIHLGKQYNLDKRARVKFIRYRADLAKATTYQSITIQT